jgi:N utilization substance protein B
MTNSPMRSRDKALQSLYEIELNNDSYTSLERTSIKNVNKFCKNLISGVINNIGNLDLTIDSYIDRSIKSLDIIEKNVLRLALYELIYKKELDTPIIINEAIRLSKKYGSNDGYKYINAILDKIVKAESLKS